MRLVAGITPSGYVPPICCDQTYYPDHATNMRHTRAGASHLAFLSYVYHTAGYESYAHLLNQAIGTVHRARLAEGFWRQSFPSCFCFCLSLPFPLPFPFPVVMRDSIPEMRAALNRLPSIPPPKSHPLDRPTVNTK